MTKNKNIHNIKFLNDKMYLITTKDNLKLYVIISDDNYYKFYTKLDVPCSKYYYYNIINMPHETLFDLYQEIERITDPKKRENKSKVTYYKAVI